MSCEIRDLLAGRSVVERDYTRIACRGEVFASGAESEGADGFDEPAQAVREARGAVVEDIYTAVLVAGSRHLAISGDVDAHAEAAFSLVLRDLIRFAVREGKCVVDVDAAVVGG